MLYVRQKDEDSSVFMCFHVLTDAHFCKMNKRPSGYTLSKTMLLRTQSKIVSSACFQGWFEGDPFSVACIAVGIALCIKHKATSLKSFIPFSPFAITTLSGF